jgi:hypothetical protein
MQKRGQNFDANEEPSEEIFYWLARGQHLTVRHIVMLLERPALLDLLGPQERNAREQLREVGNAREEAAPPNVAACIAARNLNPKTISLLVGWLRSVLPAQPVSHFWVATRLAFGLPQDVRQERSAYMRFALKQCRKHPDFAGWWGTENRFLRNALFYHRPERLYDL